MSSNLYWEPSNRKRKDVPNGLKLVLRKMYGDLQGIEMSTGDLPALRALAAANVEGANDLIAAIEKHDVIQLSEVY